MPALSAFVIGTFRRGFTPQMRHFFRTIVCVCGGGEQNFSVCVCVERVIKKMLPCSQSITWRTTKFAADSTGARLTARESGINKELVHAARDNDLDTVSRLLDEGASANAGQESGYTALGIACNRGHTHIAKLLLERGAYPDTRICDNGGTPLMVAVMWNNLEAISLLLQYNASLDKEGFAGTYRGKNALAIAVEHRRSEAAKLLVRGRAWSRWRRLKKLVPHAGRFLLALRDVFNEVHFRPGGVGALLASEEFRLLSSTDDGGRASLSDDVGS